MSHWSIKQIENCYLKKTCLSIKYFFFENWDKITSCENHFNFPQQKFSLLKSQKARNKIESCEMSLNFAKKYASRAIFLYSTAQNKNTSYKLFLSTQNFLCGNRNGLQLSYNFQWEKSYQTISSINLEKSNIIRSPCKELMLPDNVSLPEFVWEEGIKNHPDKLTLINGVTGRSYTYKEGSTDCKKFACYTYCP